MGGEISLAGELKGNTARLCRAAGMECCVGIGQLYFEFGPAIASIFAMCHPTMAQLSNLLGPVRWARFNVKVGRIRGAAPRE
jgi:hypothetical protein